MKKYLILIKTISWEIFHFLVLASIIYVLTGEWEYAGLGALVYIAIEFVGYYLHEKIWVYIKEKFKWN